METSLRNKNASFKYWLLIISSFVMYIMLTGSKNLYTANKTTFYTLGTFGNLSDIASTLEYYFYSYAMCNFVGIFITYNLVF